MDAFGIFEGGGAKGIAHIGALKAAEERKVQFIGVAGASAGAIVAALVAAGYTADKLYNPEGLDRGKLDRNLLDFFHTRTWRNLKKLRQVAASVSAFATLVKTLWNAAYKMSVFDFFRPSKWQQKYPTSGIDLKETLALVKGLPLIPFRFFYLSFKLWRNHGFFETNEFMKWFGDLLKDRIDQPSGENQTVLFGDLKKIPLKVIATNLTNGRIEIYGSEESPDVPVALAVAASISIPFVFRTSSIKGLEHTDGGLLSNFPAWVFDKERPTASILTPTFGFKLVQKLPERMGNRKGFLNFVSRVFWTAISGDEQLEIRQVENLHVVPLQVNVGSLDFDMSPGEKDGLYRSGYMGASNFFTRYIGPKNPQEMSTKLNFVHSHMIVSLREGQIHLRVNVVMRIREDRLRILYTYNMDEDTDDRLEFGIGTGACGECWKIHDFVICDLTDAKKTFQTRWRMDKYQQALVRPSLQSLLCIPIFDLDKFDRVKANVENPIIGVLSLDSDADLIDDFGDTEVRKQATECAKLIYEKLRSI